jgi:hypothetical protein
MTLWQILTGQSLLGALEPEVPANTLIGWEKHIEAGKRPPLSEVCELAADLLNNSWNGLPSERWTFGEIMDYLESIKYQLLPGVDKSHIEAYVESIKSFEKGYPPPTP